jgi:heptosyltransferase I
MDDNTHYALMRLSALGDMILILPLIETLIQNTSAKQVQAYMHPSILSLVQTNKYSIISMTKPKSIKDYAKAYKIIKDNHSSPTILLATQANLRINLLYSAFKGRKIGFAQAQARDGQSLFTNEQLPPSQLHLVDLFLSFATHLGFQRPDPSHVRWHLAIDQAQLKQKLSGLHIIINPCASKAERTPSVEFYIDLINTLKSSIPKLQITLTGSSTAFEKNTAHQLVQIFKETINNQVGQTSLVELAHLLKTADLLIAPDTGTVHLANALGTPVIGLYAVIGPELSGPYHWQDYVINHYPTALKNCLNREFETTPWGLRVHHPKAMSFFKTQEVMDKIDRLRQNGFLQNW